MGIKFSNNAVSTLSGNISDIDTSLSVQAGEGAFFPTLGGGDYFMCTLTDGVTNEIIKVTARATDAFTVERGQEGTASAAWNSGTQVVHRVTAGSLSALGGSVGSTLYLAQFGVI